jgi:hypothetical protein
MTLEQEKEGSLDFGVDFWLFPERFFEKSFNFKKLLNLFSRIY